MPNGGGCVAFDSGTGLCNGAGATNASTSVANGWVYDNGKKVCDGTLSSLNEMFLWKLTFQHLPQHCRRSALQAESIVSARPPLGQRFNARPACPGATWSREHVSIRAPTA